MQFVAQRGGGLEPALNPPLLLPPTVPSANKDISIQKILPRCYFVLAFCLRCRGLRDSFAVKATLKFLIDIDIDIDI